MLRFSTVNTHSMLNPAVCIRTFTLIQFSCRRVNSMGAPGALWPLSTCRLDSNHQPSKHHKTPLPPECCFPQVSVSGGGNLKFRCRVSVGKWVTYKEVTWSFLSSKIYFLCRAGPNVSAGVQLMTLPVTQQPCWTGDKVSEFLERDHISKHAPSSCYLYTVCYLSSTCFSFSSMCPTLPSLFFNFFSSI